jgi:hypothetical protein
MKNKFLSMSLILLCSFKLFAQNPALILAPNYILTSTPLPLPTFGPNDADLNNGYDGQKANYSQNIQVDAQGNIVFFMVEEVLYT